MAASRARATPRRLIGPGSALARESVQVWAFVLAAAWLAWRALSRLAAAWGFSTDDAYITLRYARHLLAGEGLVWNVGGPNVEGYSNFAFVLIAALFGLLGELEVAPLKLLGCAGLLATGYLQWAIARRFMRPLPALLPFALFTLTPGSVWWAVSGLETLAYTAVGCGVVLASLRGLGFGRVELGVGESVGLARTPVEPRWLAIAGGLALLVSVLRPEGPIFAVAVLLAVAVQRRLDGPAEAAAYRSGAAAFVIAFAPALAAYVGWRLASFGELLPNTVRCKTGYADRFVLLRAYWTAAPISLVLAAIQPPRSLDARVVLPGAVALIYAAALIGADPVVGGDIRHFLAAHALVCVLASVACVRLLGGVFGRWVDPRAVELGLLLGVLATASSLGGLPSRDHLRQRAEGYSARASARAELGTYLARELKPGEVAVLGDVGVAGWVGDAAILDAFCLNEPAFAEPPLRGAGDRQAAWVLAQAPAIIVVHTRSKTELKPRGGIYRALIELPAFRQGWREVQRFNASSGEFHYVVFSSYGPPDGGP